MPLRIPNAGAFPLHFRSILFQQVKERFGLLVAKWLPSVGSRVAMAGILQQLVPV
jgi:hypothetical protein